MQRYFVEVAYRGQNYAGFQIQQNANSIQAEVEKAFAIVTKQNISLTGSSRTDAGVHAQQNFFHFDSEAPFENISKLCYSLNAVLPNDIAINNILKVASDAHCRFSAVSRRYQYNVYQHKNPFIDTTAYFFPYPLNIGAMQQAADVLLQTNNFESFSKKHTQVFTFNCVLTQSNWIMQNGYLCYIVEGNRFLRGMVRGLVATMLQVGRQKITVEQFKNIIDSKNNSLADFSAPAHGLTLLNVNYPDNIF
jgi:tRNA pseudouridine38-40 synthase